jgi:hypothetical protein
MATQFHSYAEIRSLAAILHRSPGPLPTVTLGRASAPAKIRDITRDQSIERAVERVSFGADDFVKWSALEGPQRRFQKRNWPEPEGSGQV